MRILAYLYHIITLFRNYLYDKGVLKIKKIDATVICIGNITVGGTGKTPAVQYFARYFTAKGKKTAVVSRGYKGKRKYDPLIVSDGKNILAKVEESGDESFLHAKKLINPVIVGRDRYKAASLAKDKFASQVIILDDGFQHRRLHRDKNIILIDAGNPFGEFKLLPEGQLRESLNGLNRADYFIISKSDLVEKEKIDTIEDHLKKYKKPVFKAIHAPDNIKNMQTEKVCDLENIRDKKVLLFTSIANPKNFRNTVEKFAPKYIEMYTKPDHSYFANDDFEIIENIVNDKKIDMVLITEKDMVKLPEIYTNKDKFYVLSIKFEILGCDDVFRERTT